MTNEQKIRRRAREILGVSRHTKALEPWTERFANKVETGGLVIVRRTTVRKGSVEETTWKIEE